MMVLGYSVSSSILIFIFPLSLGFRKYSSKETVCILQLFPLQPTLADWSHAGVVMKCGRRRAFCNLIIKPQF